MASIDPIHQSSSHDGSIPLMTKDSDLYAKMRESLKGIDDGFVFPFDLSTYKKKL